jgi:hypothetical protein
MAHGLIEHTDGDRVIAVIVEDEEVVAFFFVHAEKPLPTVREVHLAEAVEEHRRGPIAGRAAVDKEGDGSPSCPPLSRTVGEA